MDGSKQADMNSGDDQSQGTPKPQMPYLMGADDTPQSAGTSEVRPDAASTAEQYRAVMEAAEEGIWLLDAFHKGIFVNRRMADMLGYAVHDLLGRSFYDFVDPAGDLEIAAEFRDQRLGRRTRRELALRHKSGRRSAVLSSAAQVSADRLEDSKTARQRPLITPHVSNCCRIRPNSACPVRSHPACRQRSSSLPGSKP